MTTLPAQQAAAGALALSENIYVTLITNEMLSLVLFPYLPIQLCGSPKYNNHKSNLYIYWFIINNLLTGVKAGKGGVFVGGVISVSLSRPLSRSARKVSLAEIWAYIDRYIYI